MRPPASSSLAWPAHPSSSPAAAWRTRRSTWTPATTWPPPVPRTISACSSRLREPSMREGLVDWNMAERVARALSGTGPRWDGTEEELRVESDRSAELVRRYTTLKPKGGVPPAELVDRAEWADVNLETFRDLSVRVEAHLE